MDDFHRSNADRYPLLKEFAKRMRANPTKAEELLWKCLKAGTLGIKFRRQCVILDFIADFYAPDQYLIIEVDGEYHNEETQILLDEARTKRLEAKGYNILRFSNDEIFGDIESVLNRIQEYIEM